MNRAELKSIWKKEEKTAYIKGWDFSHIHGRYEEENDLPWDYEKIVRQYLTDTAKVLDYDTGGGEFLLSESSVCQNSSDRRIRAECAIVSGEVAAFRN